MLKAWGLFFQISLEKRVSPGQKEKSFLAQISKSGNHLIAVSDGFSP